MRSRSWVRRHGRRRYRLMVVVALSAGAALISDACARRSPAVTGRLLQEQVTITRDTLGVPHILAETEEAAAFAFGYAQAEDHAVELAERLVSGRGEEAKYFGARGIDHDFALKQFDNYEEARRGLAQLSPVYRRMVGAFAAGVNLYVDQHRSALPSWIPTFSDVDVLASQRSGAAESVGGPAIVRQLQRKYSATREAATDILSEDDSVWQDQPGSNALALHGSRTTTGKPILLGNPHLSWAISSSTRACCWPTASSRRSSAP